MSASETSGQDPEPHSPQPLSRSFPPESDNIAAESIADLPPDPLLESGAFINGSIEQTLIADDGAAIEGHDDERDTDQNHQSPPPQPIQKVGSPENDSGPPGFVDAEFESPVPLNTELPVKPPTRRGRRKKSDIIGSELQTMSVSSHKPEWLPESWYVEDRVRTSGASAGAVDKYYVDTVSGHKFRSKVEALHFLETGSKRKRITKEDDSPEVAYVGSSEGHKQKSGGRKQKKTRSKKTASARNFDFINAPEKIGWVLTDSSDGSWTPFIGDEKVPESSKQEWVATFTSLQ